MLAQLEGEQTRQLAKLIADAIHSDSSALYLLSFVIGAIGIGVIVLFGLWHQSSVRLAKGDEKLAALASIQAGQQNLQAGMMALVNLTTYLVRHCPQCNQETADDQIRTAERAAKALKHADS